MSNIENFLTHHKRGCGANRGTDCTCGLYEARTDLAALEAVRDAAQKLCEELRISIHGQDIRTNWECYSQGHYDLEIALSALAQERTG